MQTLLGTPIHVDIRGVVYLCYYSGIELKVRYEGLFINPSDALQAYSSIRNPESQIAVGTTKEKFEKELQKLHQNMTDNEWIKDLANYL